ncbi:DUF3606 domain-containing protein [Pseudomonas sp. N40(2020)]|uniref:DUF3606 domain-containing protein n=1 Tax=Pseudomonas sp. N40(2020) TaxID=2767798 RepID=UPI00165757D8|nr:DUF3606 domain-containing protein [Pseudomonas sp. N40(2020)]MBC8996312.1 DUF3606 domain-containing protein [Pseudomonas sp. N40(2020)]
MADNKNITSPLDTRRIDVNDPNEVRNWCKSIGCTELQLLRAVRAVGTWANDVKVYLNK